MTLIQTFRALSGSQYVFFKSNETPPAGITDKTVVGEEVVVSVDSTAIVTEAVASSSNVIWQWNGTDLSQLTDTANLSVTDNSFLSDVPLRTCIKVDVPGAGGTYGMRRFNVDLPRRYRLRFTIGHGSAFGHIDGIAVNVQATGRYMSFGHYGSTSLSIYGFNDPTPVWPGSTPGIVSENGVSEWDLLYDSQDADGANPPRFRILFHHPLDTHYLDSDWWAPGSAGAGWLPASQSNGLGIAWLNNGGGHQAFAIYDIVVSKHPKDL
jgi:hypothetical protein